MGPVLDHTSPYFLHPAENHGTILVTPPLSENNHESWSRSMKRALLSKNKIKLISGKITTSKETDDLFGSWERCNNIVISWISASLSHNIVQSTIYIKTASYLWTKLKNRFSKLGHFRLSDLLQQVHSIHQGDKFVTSYINDLKILWENL